MDTVLDSLLWVSLCEKGDWTRWTQRSIWTKEVSMLTSIIL